MTFMSLVGKSRRRRGKRFTGIPLEQADLGRARVFPRSASRASKT